MAHVKLLAKESPMIRVCFFNDHAVGRGQTNRRDDVLLVQFLLHRLWGGKSTVGEVFGIAGKPPLAVDGDCGARTIEAIKRFQSIYYANDSGKKVIEDGVVNVAPPGQALGPLHQRTYTIIGLNVNYGQIHGRDKHFGLLNEPGFPPELRPKLFAN